MLDRIRFATISAALALAGCSANYADRRRADWAEVFTVTVGEGTGAKLRVGPAQLGLYKGSDKAGLRAGTWGQSWGAHDNDDYLWLCYGRENFEGWRTTSPRLPASKIVAATHFFPGIVERTTPHPLGFTSRDWKPLTLDGTMNAAYWTQLDLACGLGGGLRLGFNPGELLDALVGTVGLDLYDDDRCRNRLAPSPTGPTPVALPREPQQ